VNLKKIVNKSKSDSKQDGSKKCQYIQIKEELQRMKNKLLFTVDYKQ
jgi:hypothetical protein